jgi:hypothetical protein
MALELKPEILIHRKTVDTELFLTGLTSEKVTVRSQPHRLVEAAIFDAWLETTFLPELTLRRTKYQCTGPAVLFLDQCSAHTGPRFQELCRTRQVIPCYFPPHSSNQLQPLDLCLFGITKRFIARANKLDAVNIQSKHIASVVCAFLAAAVPTNVVETFEISGICLVADAGRLFCTIRPDRAKRLLLPLPSPCPEIPDISDEDFDEEELKVFIEQCTDFIGPFELEDEQ